MTWTVTGLHAAGGSVAITPPNRSSTLGDAGNNDTVTATGTSSDDLLSVTPLTTSSANVFLNGTPFISPTTVGYNGANNPGIAGRQRSGRTSI